MLFYKGVNKIVRKVADSNLPDTSSLFKASIELLLMAISKIPEQTSKQYIMELSKQIIIWMRNVHGTEPIESEIMNELKVMLSTLSLIVISC